MEKHFKKIIIKDYTSPLTGYLAVALAQAGIPVVLPAAASIKRPPKVPDGVTIVTANDPTLADCESELQNVGMVIYWAMVGEGAESKEIHLLQRLKKAQVHRLIRLEDMSQIPVDLSEKLKTLLAGFEWTRVRAHVQMQYLLGSAEIVKKEKALYNCSRQNTLAFVDLIDVAKGVLRVIEKGLTSKTLTFTGPEALSYEQICEKMSQHLGFPVKSTTINKEQIINGLRGAKAPEAMIAAYDATLTFLSSKTSSLVSKVLENIGVTPRTIDDFLKDNIRFFQPKASA